MKRQNLLIVGILIVSTVLLLVAAVLFRLHAGAPLFVAYFLAEISSLCEPPFPSSAL